MELDITQSYHQFPLHPQDKPLTAFIAPDGQTYRYCVLPMGWGPSSTLHHSYLRKMIEPLTKTPNMLVEMYADNLFIGGRNEQQAEVNKQIVSEALSKHGIEVKLEEGPTRGFIASLGRRIGPQQYTCQEEEAQKLKTTIPKNKSQTRSLFSALNWFRNFVPNFSTTVRPVS
eukprot:GHVN01101003.1.p1 GENE.GHVN01101003.1~~GHVN01101003.1.p1  ORF type:complete len:172 (+),score=16.07 GHVN01101003.1:348-863(+)